eukprot:2582429-Amphidinium_carterae.1
MTALRERELCDLFFPVCRVRKAFGAYGETERHVAQQARVQALVRAAMDIVAASEQQAEGASTEDKHACADK